MAIGNFENIGVKFANWGVNNTYIVDISETDTWFNIEVPLDTQIENNLSYNSGIINFTGNGIYMIQYVNTFNGNTGDNFSMRFFNLTLNEEVSGSVVNFTIPDDSYREFQNMMLVNLTTAYTGSFGKSTHQISMQVKNTTNTSNINIVSSSLVVIKIV